MDTFETPGVVERPSDRRPFASRLADLGDRIARAFPQPKRPEPHHLPDGTDEYRVSRYVLDYQDEVLPRFPVSRQGYDCDAVDAHVADLEQELTELERQLDEVRAQVPSRDAVAVEIERVGAQTSAILVAAHDEAQQTIRIARSHADGVIADAASYAVALTEEATLQLRELEAKTASLSRERQRLVDDIRGTAGALSSLADGASKSFPPAD